MVDHPTLELPHWRYPYAWEIELPKIGNIQITRFMITEVIAAILLVLVLIPDARHAARRPVSRGPFMNTFEAMILFIRDQVARPAIGGHGADAYLPYLWTVFFFVLFNNLLGLIPGMASATGNINVTGVLALMTLGTVLLAGMRELGAIGFWVRIVPHMDVPKVMMVLLWPLMFLIEVAGLVIRHIVLAVRLFANMFAGHMVLATILGFIFVVGNSVGMSALWVGVSVASVLGVVALGLLELFVAFLQAYVFVFLTALFMGMSLHPEH